MSEEEIDSTGMTCAFGARSHEIGTMKTIDDLSNAPLDHPINAPDLKGEYLHHIAGLTTGIGAVSRLTQLPDSRTEAETESLRISLGTCILLPASIARSESLDLGSLLSDALREF